MQRYILFCCCIVVHTADTQAISGSFCLKIKSWWDGFEPFFKQIRATVF